MRIRLLFIAAILGLSGTGAALSHEFWVSPDTYEIDTAQTLVVNTRVGQNFKGSALSYFPDQITRFDLTVGDRSYPVKSRLGDRPIMQMQMPQPGLGVIVHETNDKRLNYSEWAKFIKFVEHKAFDGVLKAHAQRGLPDSGFSESYRRFAKALVAIGDGAGQDRSFGLETEIVALANPYTDDLGAGLPVQVLYQGAPRIGAQVEVFEKLGDIVTVFTTVTDDTGRAMIPVKPAHEYLLDAVVLRSTGNDDVSQGPVWHSLWAALTFRTPDR